MNCPRTSCGQRIPEDVDRCPNCHLDVGAPNVRAASTPEECQALDERLAVALSDAYDRGCILELERFRDRVVVSEAVVCRNIGDVDSLTKSDNALYPTYYGLVQGESRLVGGTSADVDRHSVDAKFFPNYHNSIRFAALSLDRRGLTSYGNCTVVLRTDFIQDRASTFEENTLLFCIKRGGIPMGPLPPGHRSPWPTRDRLAAAKLHDRLSPGCPVSEFPGLLLQSRGDTMTDEFIEVHIFGPFTRRGIAHLSAELSSFSHDADRVLWADLKQRLASQGTTFSEH